jgi:hypothetical protein
MTKDDAELIEANQKLNVNKAVRIDQFNVTVLKKFMEYRNIFTEI